MSSAKTPPQKKTRVEGDRVIVQRPTSCFPFDVLLCKLRVPSLPPPLTSLRELRDYLATHCTDLAQPREIGHEKFLNDPPEYRVVLRCLGYLNHAPLLRILLYHLCCTNRCEIPIALEVLSLLRRDVTRQAVTLEVQLRELLFGMRTTTTPGTIIDSFSFIMALRGDTQRKLHRLKTVGPRSLLIAPSQIAVASFGLYVRGEVERGVSVLGYAGEIEEADTSGSGYRMQVGKLVIDARVERCLASMINDARFSVFSNNCRFRGSNYVRVITNRKVKNEELFVSYGGCFKFDLEQTAASFSRMLAPDFVSFCDKATLPSFSSTL